MTLLSPPPLATKPPCEIHYDKATGTCDVVTNNDVVEAWDRETVRNVRQGETLGKSFRNRWAFVDIGYLIGQMLILAREHKLQNPREILIPLIKKHIRNRDGKAEILLEGFNIDGIEEVREEQTITGFSLPITRNGTPAYRLIYNLQGGDTNISIEGGANVYVTVETTTEKVKAKRASEPATLMSFIPVILSGRDDGTYEKHGVSFFVGEDSNFYYGLTAQHVVSNIKGVKFGLLIEGQVCLAEGIETERNTGFAGISASSFFGSQPPEKPADFALFKVPKSDVTAKNIKPTIFLLSKNVGVSSSGIPICAFGVSENRGGKEVAFENGLAEPSQFSGILKITDTEIREGFSGSPIVDVRTGEVIGIDVEGSRAGAEKVSYAILSPNIIEWIHETCLRENINITMPELGKDTTFTVRLPIANAEETKKMLDMSPKQAREHSIAELHNLEYNIIHYFNSFCGLLEARLSLWSYDKSNVELTNVLQQKINSLKQRRLRLPYKLTNLKKLESAREVYNNVITWIDEIYVILEQIPCKDKDKKDVIRTLDGMKYMICYGILPAISFWIEKTNDDSSTKLNTIISVSPESERIHATNLQDALTYIQAQPQTQPLIVALGTSWIKGYEKGRYLQYDALNPLIGSLRTYCESKGIPFIVEEDDKLLARINAERAKEGKAGAKVVVLAGKDTVASDEFTTLRNDQKNTFVVGVDNQELTTDSYIRLMEMLTLALKLSAGLEVNINNDHITITKDNERHLYIFLPHAEPMDYERLKTIYEVQKFA